MGVASLVYDHLSITHTHTDMLNAFQVSHAEKSFHVVAMTPADKANWLSNLMKYIRKASSQGTHHLQFITCCHGNPAALQRQTLRHVLYGYQTP